MPCHHFNPKLEMGQCSVLGHQLMFCSGTPLPFILLSHKGNSCIIDSTLPNTSLIIPVKVTVPVPSSHISRQGLEEEKAVVEPSFPT